MARGTFGGQWTHSLYCGVDFMGVDVCVPKLIKLYTLNMCSLLLCQLYLNKAIIFLKSRNRAPEPRT